MTQNGRGWGGIRHTPGYLPGVDFATIDQHVAGFVGLDDPAAPAAARADAAGLPAIAVSPLQGKFLHLLARTMGARRILELGTLGGYSTIWLGQAVPADGEVVTIELDPRHAEVAAESFAAAGLDGVIDLRVGAALEVLEGVDGPFDLAFLDADKATMSQQVELVIPRVRPGGLIICDNVIRGGAVVDSADASPAGARGALEVLAADPRVDATVLQTVGLKGHDGFAYALVR